MLSFAARRLQRFRSRRKVATNSQASAQAPAARRTPFGMGAVAMDGRRTFVLTTGAAALLTLAACGDQNHYVAPPPPKVTVAAPTKQAVTRYLELTGNTAAVNSADLVARVSGFVQEVQYQDGAIVKKGTPLFTIEPEPYDVKLKQAQAAEARRAGDPEAGAGRVRSPERAGGVTDRQPLLVRPGHRQPRCRAGLVRPGPRQHPARPAQLRLCPRHRAVRRRRDGAAGLGRPVSSAAAGRRPCSPPSCRSIRSM